MRIRLLIGLLAIAAQAADRPGDIDVLIDQARGAPPEFAADALLRIAALPGLAKTRRVALLTESFGVAGGAHQPYKRRSAGVDTSGLARFYSHVYQLNLDALSLRLRAIEALLPLEPRKARQLFESLPRLSLPSATCSDYMVYDVDRYYEILGRVARETFDAEETRKGEPARLLAFAAGAITSPVQVGSAADVISSASVPDTEFQKLLPPFADALTRIGGDDRSFSAARGAGAQIRALAQEYERRKVSPQMILAAWRSYLVNHLSAARCADSPALAAAGPEEPARPEDPVNYFNRQLAMPPAGAIEAREVVASKTEGTAAVPRPCDTAECRAIAEQFRAVVFDSNGQAWTAERRATTEWKTRLSDFLSALAAWQPGAGTDDAEFFREKIGVYTDLFGVMTDRGDRERAAQAAIQFLAASRFRAADLAEWFLPVSVMIGRARLDPVALAWLARDLEASADPLMAFFAKLERIAPRDPQEILSLM